MALNSLTNRTIDLWKLWRKADAEVLRITRAALNDVGPVKSDALIKRSRDHARAVEHRVAILRHLDAEAGSMPLALNNNLGDRRDLRAAE